MLTVTQRRQIQRILGTYAADISGTCSALYELGGMVIMHDASGCFSTYTTHDEPRWSKIRGMVFLSGLTEMDAVLGNDSRLIDNAVDAAEKLHPRFVCIIGTPIPMMMGTDLDAIARVIGERTGIPGFGINANCSHSYGWGIGAAYARIARDFVREDRPDPKEGRALRVNVLGMTPLDFGLGGSDISVCRMLERSGFEVNSLWAMGERSNWDEMLGAAKADVNLVCSAGGMEPARELKRRFGTPFVSGLPTDRTGEEILAGRLRAAAEGRDAPVAAAPASVTGESSVVIGDPVQSGVIREFLEREAPEFGHVRMAVPYPMIERTEYFRPDDLLGIGESEIEDVLKSARVLIADPIYRTLLPEGNAVRVIELPHPALSARLYFGREPVWGKTDFRAYFGL